MKNRKRNLAIIILFLLALAGCAGQTPLPQDQPQATSWKLLAYNTLAESKIAYDKAFTALGLADQAGKLSATDKALTIKYGAMYRDAHNLAVNMLLNNMQPNLEALRLALGLFQKVALPYLSGGTA